MKIIKIDKFEGGTMILLDNDVFCSIYENGELDFECLHSGEVPDETRVNESTEFVMEHFGPLDW